jgi:hypothetical protein
MNLIHDDDENELSSISYSTSWVRRARRGVRDGFGPPLRWSCAAARGRTAARGPAARTPGSGSPCPGPGASPWTAACLATPGSSSAPLAEAAGRAAPAATADAAWMAAASGCHRRLLLRGNSRRRPWTASHAVELLGAVQTPDLRQQPME